MDKVVTRAGRTFITCLLFLLMTFLIPVPAKAGKQEIHFQYYYINLCENCREAEDTIKHYNGIFRSNSGSYDIKIMTYNISQQKNLEQMYEMCQAYGVPGEKKKVPLLFAGDSFYYGEADIHRGLLEINGRLEEGIVPKPLLQPDGGLGEAGIRNEFVGIKGLNVFMVGLVNGLNPCSLSMLLFLLSLLLARKEIRIIHVGLAFLLGKFAAYILLGTIMYNLLNSLNIAVYSAVFKTVMGLFAGLLAALNIRDYFNARRENYGEIKNQLPSGLRKWNHQIMARFNGFQLSKSLILAAGILGMVISVGEFLCTGQVYLAAIIYLLQTGNEFTLQAFWYLVVYSLAFIIPAAAALVIINHTRRLMGLSESLRAHLPLIKISTAVVLLITGAAVILGS